VSLRDRLRPRRADAVSVTVGYGKRETAASQLVARVPRGTETDTVADVLSRLPDGDYESANAIYILRPDGTLSGLVPLPTLLSSTGDRALGELMMTDLPSVRPSDDQEDVALAALRCGVAAVPVVDDQGILLGVVPPQSLLAILHREHIEDLHRLAGMQRERGWAQSALEAPPRRQLWHRLPWLIAGFAGSAAAALVMSRYQRALEARVAIAFFIPGIVYLADAIGTQSQTVAVRGMSLSQASLRSLVGHELMTGLLAGTILAALAFPGVLWVFDDLRLAGAVSSALVFAGGVAGALGLLLPWIMERMGTDPAFGSGPITTILQDVLSLLIYFVAISLFFG